MELTSKASSYMIEAPQAKKQRGANREWSAMEGPGNKPLTFLTKEIAVEFARGHDQWVKKNGRGLMQCVFHADCDSWRKVVLSSTLAQTWQIEEAGEHTEDMEYKERGIPKALLEIFDIHLASHGGAINYGKVVSKVKKDLATHHSAENEFLLEELKFLTSTSQLLQDFKIRLENRKKILRHLPELCIKTLAELNHFASQRLVKYLCYIIYILKSSLILSILHQMTTKAQYDAEADLDKMIVLSTTTNAKEVLHASDINPPTLPVVSDGVIFSSKRHLHNIMLALEANVDGFAVQVDGTFKITTGSAVLLVLVTTSITVGPTITHTPRPLMYGFVPSESEYATATLLHCFQAAARQLLGIKRMPPITTAAIDHALGFRLGLKRVFPYVTIISCYFHMLKNVQQNTAKKIMNEANKGRIV
jgi:hypothetical protein